MNEELLEKSIQIYLEQIEGKNWADLTKNEMKLIADEVKKVEYLKKYKECMENLILPLLYSMSNSSNFKFSNPDSLLTCNNMMKDIYNYYQKRGFKKAELSVIASEKDPKKNH